MARVKVESTSELYTQIVSTRSHTWVADEIEESGGSDAGPSPHELLLSGLGACMTITAQMYARRKEWPLRRVRMELEQRKIEASECDDCETREGKVTEIHVEILLEGDLDEEQRRRIVEIAGRCPVKQTLTGEVKVRSNLVENAVGAEPQS